MTLLPLKSDHDTVDVCMCLSVGALIVCSVVLSLQLMATGACGSRGENALLPVGAERGHASVSVTVHPLTAVVVHVQVTPPSCPGVTLRPAQVRRFCIARVQFSAAIKANLKYLLFLSGGPQKARGSIIGNINGIEFGIAILNATISDSKAGSKIIKARITNVPRTLGQQLHILKSHTFRCILHKI